MANKKDGTESAGLKRIGKQVLLSSVLLAVFFIFECFFVALDAVALEQDGTFSQEDGASGWERFREFVVGQPAQDTIYLGMWSHHFIDNSDDYQTTHNLLAITYRGFYGGTFQNSLDDRTWGAGIQRDVYRTNLDSISIEIGYRLGILYGYDSMEVYDTGLFPLLQLYSDLHYKNVGVQFSWAGSVVTVGFLVRF